jgi:hypothetical protein
VVDGTVRNLVMARTRVAQGFGHDYPADRAWQALYGHVAYNSFPANVRSLDVGFARASGTLVSAGDATEFFQLVEKAEGRLYWLDLDRMLTAPVRSLDVKSCCAWQPSIRVRPCGRSRPVVIKRESPAGWPPRRREREQPGHLALGLLLRARSLHRERAETAKRRDEG